MIYVKKVTGFGTEDLKNTNKRKLFRQTAKKLAPLDKLFERRVFREQLAEKANDREGITVNEMADIVTEEICNKKDKINKREAREMAHYFGISKRRLMKARERYRAKQGNQEDEKKGGIAKPYGQRDDDHGVLGRRAGLDDESGHTPSTPPASAPRRPMF